MSWVCQDRLRRSRILPVCHHPCCKRCVLFAIMGARKYCQIIFMLFDSATLLHWPGWRKPKRRFAKRKILTESCGSSMEWIGIAPHLMLLRKCPYQLCFKNAQLMWRFFEEIAKLRSHCDQARKSDELALEQIQSHFKYLQLLSSTEVRAYKFFRVFTLGWNEQAVAWSCACTKWPVAEFPWTSFV